MSSEAVERILYGETAIVRDHARADLIRSGSARALLDLTRALSASLDTTRRRATRLLSDLQPHRARPVIIKWLEEIENQQWQAQENRSVKGLKEGVAHAARLLNQMTIRGEREESLIMIYSSGLQKAQRATICPASPDRLLLLALTHPKQTIIESALSETLRRLDQLEEGNRSLRDTFITHLRAHCPIESYRMLKSLDSDLLGLWTRLFAHLYPKVNTWVDIPTLVTLNLLPLYDHIGDLSSALENAVKQRNLPLILQLLIALEQRQRSTINSTRPQLSPQLYDELKEVSSPEIRAVLARILPDDAPLLHALKEDPSSSVSWCAKRSINGCFSPAKVHSRLGDHQRLKLPSAQPPYGLRSFDDIPKIERVSGALALCQARFDVNLGVAMRSAEAAGLKEVFVIGARSGSLTSARGAEYAIPIHWLPDAHSLIMIARTRGYQMVAVQQTPDSEPYHIADYPPQPLFVLGSEDAGLPDALRVGADLVVEIPLFGTIDSLNVATAATCVIMHWRAHLKA